MLRYTSNQFVFKLITFFYRTKFGVAASVDMVDGVVTPEVAVETEVAGRPRVRLNLKKFSDVMMHIVTKVHIFV